MRNMFDDMVDVISQLVLKWERCARGGCCLLFRGAHAIV